MSLQNKNILITGGARRIGRHLTQKIAEAGGNIIIHHSNSPQAAQEAAEKVRSLGQQAWIIQGDFSNPNEARRVINEAISIGDLFAVINNASIFEPFVFANTTLDAWQRHIDVNLTAPFILSQQFAAHLPESSKGRIINILDWRSLRPGRDHFPYTISKAALAAMTQSLAYILAPRIIVNGLLLGAILPPSDGEDDPNVLKPIPAGRWAELEEVSQSVLFLLDGPEYITGELIHLDGGRHLV